MNAWMLLLLITLMYAGYNLFVKVSGDHAAGTVTTTILATISLQTAALVVSLMFAAYLLCAAGRLSRFLQRPISGQCFPVSVLALRKSATFIFSRVRAAPDDSGEHGNSHHCVRYRSGRVYRISSVP